MKETESRSLGIYKGKRVCGRESKAAIPPDRGRIKGVSKSIILGYHLPVDRRFGCHFVLKTSMSCWIPSMLSTTRKFSVRNGQPGPIEGGQEKAPVPALIFPGNATIFVLLVEEEL
jgi:hypothetical protein